MIRTHHNRFAARLGAFTIIEMMVTIGILVIVAAGVATIFASVGDVVSKGRKLSELNQFAARIERVMRSDFESMTRDGFLVIVNKNANSGNDVRLYRGEQSDPDTSLYGAFSGGAGRVRRSDEIMFFARGDFETARRAISPNMIASSNEAAIYYGHGQKRRPDLIGFHGAGNYFFNPQPWDNNYDNTLDTRLGVETIGFVNPNEFARDWSLLRQVTLLVNPAGHGQRLPQDVFGLSSSDPAQRPFLRDSERQVALQPAARSIFTALSGSAGYANHWLYDTSGVGPIPANPPPSYRVSGQVDIVTQDLASIRNMVQALAGAASPETPSKYFDYDPPRPPMPANPPIIIDKDTFDANYAQDPVTPPNPSDALNLNLGSYTNSGGWISGNGAQIDTIRKWMIDALPSRWNLEINGSAPGPNDFISGVRYEDIPTRIMYPNENSPDYPFDAGERGYLQRAYAEANQEMLGASVFVPRCTEFVVEWSYGYVDNSITVATDPRFKKLIWYGLDRYVDSDNDGQLEQSDQRAALPYTQRTSGAAGTDPANNNQRRVQGPDPQLIVGKTRPMAPGGNPAPLSPDTVEIATFGFATKPDKPGAVWPWPKLIRITMRLGDPTDRDVEQTYQVVFELPEPE